MEKVQINKNDVEGLLFVAKEPLKIEDIAKILNDRDDSIDEATVLRWVIELQGEYSERGIRIRQVAGGFEMVTADDVFETVEKLLPKQYERLSRSALETAAAIVVNQPATRATIAKFRGVKNPDDAIEKLLERKLISHTEEGYIITDEFLKQFGINDLKELKEFKKQMEALSKEIVEEVQDFLEENATDEDSVLEPEKNEAD